MSSEIDNVTNNENSMNKRKLEKQEDFHRFIESKERFKNYKFSYIYFLEINAKFYNGTHPDAELVDEANYSEVYSSMEDAKKDGLSYLNDELDFFIKDNNAQYDKDRTANLKGLIDEGIISYYFAITKVDPYYRDNFYGPSTEEYNIGLVPTSTTYTFDFEGNLRGHYEESYNCTKFGLGYSAFLKDEDLQEGAGLKFNYGDIVHDKRSDEDYMIIKHWSDTLRQWRRELWMNKYWGVSINKDGSLEDYCDDLFESNLTLITKAKDVANDSPWAFIYELYRNQERIKDNYWKKFWDGEINFLPSKSWRDVTIEDIINM